MAGDYEHNDYPVSVCCFIHSHRIDGLTSHRHPSIPLTRLILPRPSIRLMPPRLRAPRRSPALCHRTRFTLLVQRCPSTRFTPRAAWLLPTQFTRHPARLLTTPSTPHLLLLTTPSTHLLLLTTLYGLLPAPRPTQFGPLLLLPALVRRPSPSPARSTSPSRLLLLLRAIPHRQLRLTRHRQRTLPFHRQHTLPFPFLRLPCLRLLLRTT